MKIALISFEPVWEDADSSMKKCISLFQRLKKFNLEVCIFPESTLTGFSFSGLNEVSSLSESKYVKLMMEAAKDMGIVLVFGLFHKCDENSKIFNSALVLNRNGDLILRYDKLHLFSPGREDRFISRGSNLGTFAVADTSFGVSICYDLRFPELYSLMAAKCSILINIANWPSQRNDHWSTLLRARSIENQAYVVGVNRYGFDGDQNFFEGRSLVFDPWGELLKPDIVEDEVSVYDVDLTRVKQVRGYFPVIQDRRFKPVLK